MPQEFNKCVDQGGKVRTKSLNKTDYMHFCIINGKSYAGEVRKYKKILKANKK